MISENEQHHLEHEEVNPDIERKKRFRFKNDSKRKTDGKSRITKVSAENGRCQLREPHQNSKPKKNRSKQGNYPPHSPLTTEPEASCTSNPHDASYEMIMDPEIAFRESLFDAMADDEGAQFWEGVYGQPIHTYPNIKSGPDGKLELMTDEEYTAYVRSKMYEKTHQFLIEEREKRESARKEREKLSRESARLRKEAKRFRRQVEESIKRGEERNVRKNWSEKWNHYITRWEALDKDRHGIISFESIPWPTASGNQTDIDIKEIERFFMLAPTSGQPSQIQLGKTLKLERIRWHPDKIQQKFGSQDVSKDILKAVTSIFQIIDSLWSRSRDDQ
ncbi:unnamed protein product [Blumeria hordei]|uniref:Uncharacterized protein n=1 Tax=Blumeria hordei TaxID=2867405 RepID=A0A383UKX5_BLUHO|nr:unnamed protein product [Blumeria hordei]